MVLIDVGTGKPVLGENKMRPLLSIKNLLNDDANSSRRSGQRTIAKRETRYEARFRGVLKLAGFSSHAEIHNMSLSGMAVRLLERAPVIVGDEITLTSPEVGVIHGSTRWRVGDFLGIEFDTGTNTRAKVAAYFKFYHRKQVRKPQPTNA